MSSDPVDLQALRHALGGFATGVTVVTTLDDDGAPRGFTANSFTSVSLEPPLVLFCLAREASVLAAFAAARHFAVNILADDQRDISVTFATGAPDKFDGVAWHGGSSGSPLLTGAVSWFDCRVEQRFEAGDHVVFVGRVLDFDSGGGMPLGYFRGAYVPFGLGSKLARTPVAAAELRVGAIVESDGALLLGRAADGTLGIPVATRLGSAAQPDSLIGRLAAIGAGEPALFLFSVFDEGGYHTVVYRGDGVDSPAAPLADPDWRFVPFDEIDWQAVTSAAAGELLRRYIRERAADAFGVYVGESDAGD